MWNQMKTRIRRTIVSGTEVFRPFVDRARDSMVPVGCLRDLELSGHPQRKLPAERLEKASVTVMETWCGSGDLNPDEIALTSS